MTTGFVRIFNLFEHRIEREARLLAGGDFAEFLDVGSGDERAPAADQHDGAYFGVLFRRLDPCENAFRNSGAQRVHRRIIDGDDADFARGA